MKFYLIMTPFVQLVYGNLDEVQRVHFPTKTVFINVPAIKNKILVHLIIALL